MTSPLERVVDGEIVAAAPFANPSPTFPAGSAPATPGETTPRGGCPSAMDDERDGHVLGAEGHDRQGVEDLVESEHPRGGIGAPGRVDQPAEAVEGAADDDEDDGAHARAADELGEDERADPPQRDAERREEPRRRVPPDHRGG